MSSDSLLRCMSPLLAQSGQTEPTAVCPLSGAKRTLLALRPIVMPRIHCGYNANRLRSFCSYWLSKAPHARGEAPILKGSKRQGPGKGDCREGWLMDTPMTGFVRVSSLEELKVRGGWSYTGHIDRYLSSTTKIVSSRSTIAALTWAFPWIAAASRTAP